MTSSFYQGQEKYFVSVDCFCIGFKDSRLYVLIAKRKFEPLIGEDSLMGGFVRPDESVDAAASRVLSEYTGIEDVYMEQVGTYGEVERDLADRVISIAYYALIDIESFNEELCLVHNTRWVEINQVGKLVFDHNKILKDTISILEKRATSSPVMFNLLPEKFTLPQLQSLYETIYSTTFDKRNFRKKILDMNILDKKEDKDKSASKRGAFYYTFDTEKYNLFLQKGGHFSL